MVKMAVSKQKSSSSQSQSAAAAIASSWPPLSLTPHDRSRCEEILRYAEDLEVSGSSSTNNNNNNNNNSVHLQVQMACLLVLGDVAACRHLWRRVRDNKSNNNALMLLEPWWNVAAAMLSNRYTAVWEGLQNLMMVAAAAAAASSSAPSSSSTTAASLPTAIIQTYATEIAQAYRHRLLKKVLIQNQQHQPTFLPEYYTTVFGFAQARELQEYYQQFLLQQQQQQQQAAMMGAQQQHSTLTCFLEAQRRNL